MASRWVDIGTASASVTAVLRQEVSRDRISRWAQRGWIVARRLASGEGPWRVLLGPDGLTVVADTAEVPSPRRPRSPPRWVWLQEAVAAAGVTEGTVRRWVRRKKVLWRRTVSRNGPLQVLLDLDGLPADATPVPGTARLTPEDIAGAAESQEAPPRLCAAAGGSG